MKYLICSLALTLTSIQALAANSIDDYQNRILAEMLARQVVTKKLLPATAKRHYADLTRAIEGSGNSPIENSLTKITCERGLGSDYCTITVVGENSNDKVEPEYSFDLYVKTYQGTVQGVEVMNEAG